MSDDRDVPEGEQAGTGTPEITAIDDALREVYRNSAHLVATAGNTTVYDITDLDTMSVSLNLPRKGRPIGNLDLDTAGVSGEWTVGGLLFVALKHEPANLHDSAWDDRERETDTLDETEAI